MKEAVQTQPEIIRRHPSVTPRELGLTPSTIKLGNLMREPIDVLTTKDKKGRKVFCGVFRPVHGPSLLRLLTGATIKPDGEIAPYMIEDVLDDWDIFEDAKTDSDLQVTLDQHLKDPVIKHAMKTFGQDYVEDWICALACPDPKALEKSELTEVVDMRYFPEQFLQEIKENKAVDVNRADLITSKNFPESLAMFNQFVREQRIDASYVLNPKTYYYDDWRDVWKSFYDSEEGVAIVTKYVDWLHEHPEQRNRLITRLIVEEQHKILIDVSDPDAPVIHTPAFMSRAEYREASITTRPGVITIEDKEIRVVKELIPPVDPRQRYTSWETMSMVDNPEVDLAPVVAWRYETDPDTGEEQRRLVERDEILELFGPALPQVRVDDWLGTAALNCLKPEVRDSRLVKKMHLDGVKDPQNMGPAQIGTSVNRATYREWLARDNTFFQEVEARVTK